jgi:hypothetical protein
VTASGRASGTSDCYGAAEATRAAVVVAQALRCGVTGYSPSPIPSKDGPTSK